MARFVAALLGGGANEHGAVLEPATLATMFEPHYQPDPRLPGMGLGFFRGDAGGHRVVGHDGILPGFNSELLVAPDDGVGVIGLHERLARSLGGCRSSSGGCCARLLGVAGRGRAQRRPPASGGLGRDLRPVRASAPRSPTCASG